LIEFDYYSWSEFQKILSSWPQKDEIELASTISKIQKYGMQIAKQQGWAKKLTRNLFEIRTQRAHNIQRIIYLTRKDHPHDN